MPSCHTPSAILMAAHAAPTLVFVLLVAVGVGLALAAIIKRLRMTPEEKAAEAAQQEADRLASEAEAERLRKAMRKRQEEHAARDAALSPPGPAEPPTPGLVIWGQVLLWIGGLLLAFFLFLYTTAVESGGGAVNNLGLMNNRLIGVIISSLALLLGTLCFLTQCVLEALPEKPPHASAIANSPPAPTPPPAP